MVLDVATIEFELAEYLPIVTLRHVRSIVAPTCGTTETAGSKGTG